LKKKRWRRRLRRTRRRRRRRMNMAWICVRQAPCKLRLCFCLPHAFASYSFDVFLDSKDRSNVLLRSISELLPDYTAPYPWRSLVFIRFWLGCTLDHRGVGIRFLAGDINVSFAKNIPTWCWVHPAAGAEICFSGGKAADRLAVPPASSAERRMHGAVPPLPHYIMPWRLSVDRTSLDFTSCISPAIVSWNGTANPGIWGAFRWLGNAAFLLGWF
jgi:hypothetical protein